MKDLLSIVSHFQLQGTVQEIKPLGAGLINDTYKVSTLGTDAPPITYCSVSIMPFSKMWKCCRPISMP